MLIKVSNDLTKDIISIVDKYAPFQSVLLLYDFSAPSCVIENIQHAIKDKCILSKCIVQNSVKNETVYELVRDTNFRTIIFVAQDSTLLQLSDVIGAKTFFVPTNFSLLSAFNLSVTTLFSSDTIMQNFKSSTEGAYLTLSGLTCALIDAKFDAIIHSNRTNFNLITNLLSIINIKSMSITETYDTTEVCDIYGNIIETVCDSVSKNGIDLYFPECDEKDFCSAKVLTKLGQYSSILQVYLHTFNAIHTDNYNYIDLYKEAKAYGEFTQKYMDTINYYYSLYHDNATKDIFNLFYPSFTYSLTSAVRLLERIKGRLSIDNPQEQVSATTIKSVTQNILDSNISHSRKHLLSYAKLFNVL